MVIGSSILNFFKPEQKAQKRPAQDADAEEIQERRTRSKSPIEPLRPASQAISTLDPAKASQLPRSSNPALPTDTSSLTSLSDIEPVSSPIEDVIHVAPSRPMETRAVNGSFLSSGSFSGSSQRVTRNGEEMVIDSDNDDSDGSLEDLDDIIGISKPKSQITPATPASVSQLSSVRNTRSNKAGLLGYTPKATPSVPKYKFSLDALAATVKKENAHNEEIEAALKEAQMSDMKTSNLTNYVKFDSEINTSLLASMIKEEEDEDNVERVMKAVERTEALQGKREWLFFTQEPRKMSAPEFPGTMLEPYNLLLSKPLERDAAILGGFLAEIAAKEPLPDELVGFFLSSALQDRRSDFHHAYCEILEKSVGSVTQLLNPQLILDWLSALGAGDEFLHSNYVVRPYVRQRRNESSPPRDWSRLHTTLRLLERVARAMNYEVRKTTLISLSKIALDADAGTDVSTTSLLKNAFVAVLDLTPESEVEELFPEAMLYIFNHLKDPQLRAHLLQVLTTPSVRACAFRKQLALAFFFESPIYIETWPGPIPSLLDFNGHLQRDSKFVVADNRDYVQLGSMIDTLDIGIDDGGAPREVNTSIEKEYNKTLDKLTTTIYIMQANIKDTGANHLARTEAKEALEVLQRRLEFSVRTRRKPRQDILGKGLGSNKGIKEFFSAAASGQD